jgi:alcohol dehydrogenase class IV
MSVNATVGAFELAAPARVRFGPGVRREVGTAAAGLGATRALLVTGRSPARAAELAADLSARGIAVRPFPVEGEPSVETARAGVRAARDAAAEVVIACGGGSALDAGKAIAVLAAAGAEDVLEHLEVVGRGRPLTRPGLPFIAVPTTAGTGSEVTRNAVLSVPEARVKASLRSPSMLAHLAAVDPDLLAGAPPAVIAASGLDALSQVIEPFLSIRANPVTDALAREGIRRAARSLGRAYTEGLGGPGGGGGGGGGGSGAAAGEDAAAARREDLALASLMGGLCLANAGLGAVHGFAAPVGGMFGAPHGAVCAALLPHVLEVNLRALRARASTHPALPRFHELGALVTGEAAADLRPEDGIRFVADLCRRLDIPGLGRAGMTAGDIPALVEKAKAASSMKGNPLPLTDAELAEIAERAL